MCGLFDPDRLTLNIRFSKCFWHRPAEMSESGIEGGP